MVRLRSPQVKISAVHNPSRGQTSLEYLLLLAIVAVIVIASFGPHSLISKVHDAAQDYYNTVTRVIMDSDGTTTLANGTGVDIDNPAPINGGWCPVTCPSAGSVGPTVMYRACECPAPAFGGSYCSGSSAVDCTKQGVIPPSGPCATGQVYNSTGQCVCPNGLVCGSGNGPTGSIPSTDCSQCVCMAGWYYDQAQKACINYCPGPCTTFKGASCAPTDCSSILNSTCNPNCPSTTECACDQYSYWGGSSCVYCQATCSGCPNSQCTDACNNGAHCTSLPPSNGNSPCPTQATSCQPLTGPSERGGCPDNMWCNGKLNSCQCDEDPGNNFYTRWNGSACVQVSGPCTPGPFCPTSDGTLSGSSLPNGCGTDSCGSPCGANAGSCPAGQQCKDASDNSISTTTAGTVGTCATSCPVTESWNGTKCVPLTPCGSNNCGFDSDGKACGSLNGQCPSGEPCSSGDPNSSTKILPGLCCLSCQTLINGACVSTTPCGNDCGGSDSCGNLCWNKGGKCYSDQVCYSGTCCTPSTCASLGRNTCGNPPDGCGGTLSCGSCPNKGTCSSSYQCTSS